MYHTCTTVPVTFTSSVYIQYYTSVLVDEVGKWNKHHGVDNYSQLSHDLSRRSANCTKTLIRVKTIHTHTLQEDWNEPTVAWAQIIELLHIQKSSDLAKSYTSPKYTNIEMDFTNDCVKGVFPLHFPQPQGCCLSLATNANHSLTKTLTDSVETGEIQSICPIQHEYYTQRHWCRSDSVKLSLLFFVCLSQRLPFQCTRHFFLQREIEVCVSAERHLMSYSLPAAGLIKPSLSCSVIPK